MFLGCIVAPMTTYLYVWHPSWTWLYLVNPESVPGFALLPLVAGHAVAMIAGWYLGARLVIAKKESMALYLAGAGLFLTLVGIAVFWGRLSEYGTYTEYWQNRSLDIMVVKLGYVLVAMALGTIAAAMFVAVELSRDSRRVRSH